eukprot:1365762-Alexandrium_andersonii.AAC.1
MLQLYRVWEQARPRATYEALVFDLGVQRQGFWIDMHQPSCWAQLLADVDAFESMVTKAQRQLCNASGDFEEVSGVDEAMRAEVPKLVLRWHSVPRTFRPELELGIPG